MSLTVTLSDNKLNECRKKFGRSAGQHGYLIYRLQFPTLIYFKDQYSLLLQYEILEKLVTYKMLSECRIIMTSHVTKITM